jgi:hypothetical protein
MSFRPTQYHVDLLASSVENKHEPPLKVRNLCSGINAVCLVLTKTLGGLIYLPSITDEAYCLAYTFKARVSVPLV